MYIHQIVIEPNKDYPIIPKLHLKLVNEWTKEPLKSLLISGVNGSGKTTLLKIIAALWENFHSWLRLSKSLNDRQQGQGGILRRVDLAAIEIRDLVPNASVWLYEAANPAMRELLRDYSQTSDYMIGETLKGQMGRGRATIEPENPTGWMRELWDEVEKATVGISDNKTSKLPNMVYLEAESRQILPLNLKEKPTVYGEALYQWLSTYKAGDRWQGHPEAVLANQKVRDAKKFNQIIRAVNDFLLDKTITDFDENLRLRIRIKDSRSFHYIDELSSGERQALLLMAMVSRWLMFGGIVLIDEPDLHMHVALQRAFIHSLEKLILDMNGQLIITSHSPEIWEEYTDHNRFDLGMLRQRNKVALHD